jgi:hypothetical protein
MSWMLLRAPMRIGRSSPRSTHWNHTLEPAPMVTSPITAAVGATNASGAILGMIPL